jgi:hypothetical protein
MLVKIARRLDLSPGALLGDGAASPVGPPVFENLGAPGALELVNAYAKISRADLRQSVVHLAKTLAKAFSI